MLPICIGTACSSTQFLWGTGLSTGCRCTRKYAHVHASKQAHTHTCTHATILYDIYKLYYRLKAHIVNIVYIYVYIFLCFYILYI